MEWTRNIRLVMVRRETWGKLVQKEEATEAKEGDKGEANKADEK
jgi:hypothetical protein